MSFNFFVAIFRFDSIWTEEGKPVPPFIGNELDGSASERSQDNGGSHGDSSSSNSSSNSKSGGGSGVWIGVGTGMVVVLLCVIAFVLLKL